MDTSTTPLPDSKVVLSLDVIKGDLKLQLSKLGFQYEAILQAASNITFSKETLDQDFMPLKKLRELSVKAEALENPYTAKWKAWNEAKKSLTDPLKTEIATKTAAYTKLATEIKKELDEQAEETARIKTITEAKAAFIIDFAGKTAAATTIDELIALQMRIGTEKSRKGFWQEYLPDFVEACKGLETGLKTQKEKLRKLQGLEEKEKTATDEQLLAILDEKEILTAELEQGKTDVQETVMQTATKPIIERTVGLSTFIAPKARRTSKKWRVDNVELLYKKRPDLVDLIPNKEKIDAIMDERKKEKVFKGITSEGIIFYEEKLY